jgi:hypothetical protein
MAVILDGRAMDHADVLHALREVGRVVTLFRDGDSNIVERLRDCQAKLGMASHERYTGIQKRMVNQMKTGTVSPHTFFNVLDRRLKRVCVCSMCKIF